MSAKNRDDNKKRQNVKDAMQRKSNAVMKKSMEVVSMMSSDTDPNGSYTGVAENPYDKPVQDVDDL